jgi:hypothetical protein
MISHNCHVTGTPAVIFSVSLSITKIPVNWSFLEAEVNLRLTVSQSVCLGVEPTLTYDQMLFPAWRLLSESCCLLHVRRPLWREDGSVVCSVIPQWSESRRTRNHILNFHFHNIMNHILKFHVRLPQPEGPGSRIYIPQEHGSLVIPPGTGFPSRRFLRLARLRWRYSNPPQHGKNSFNEGIVFIIFVFMF